MKKRKTTFSEILKQSGHENSERLMRRARLANRLAKKSRGASRAAAYDVKARALCSLVKKLPGCVRVSRDIKLTDFVVVELKGDESGLHLPSAKLADN